MGSGTLRPDRALLVVALALVLGLGLRHDWERSLWLDEAYSLDTAGRSFAETFHRARDFELQPPLYFLLLNLWLRVSPTIELARLLSTIAAAGAVVLLASLGRTLGLAGSPLNLALLAALCPFLLWAASEARGYALTIALSSAATLMFARLWIAGSSRPMRDGALYVAFGLLGLLVSHLSGFLLLGHLVAALLVPGRRKAVFACGAALLVLFLPWAAAVPDQVASLPLENAALVPPDPQGQAPTSPVLVPVYVVADRLMGGAPITKRPAFLLALALALATVVAARLRRGSEPWSRTESMLTIVASVPCAALVTLLCLDIAPIARRHYAVAIVGVLALLARLAGGIRPLRLRTAAAAFLLAVFAAGTTSFVRNSEAPTDWRAAARFLEGNALAQEPLFFFEADMVLPFRYYYRGSSPVHGLPRDSRLERFDRATQTIRSEDEVAAAVERAVAGGGRFWLVSNGCNRWLGGPLLQSFVRTHTEVLGKHDVEGVRILHLRRPDPALGVAASGPDLLGCTD